MKRFVLAIAAGMLFLSGCSGNGAKEMFETAQLEELQRNFPHSRQLYREIVEKYPKSDYAAKAAERLKEIEKE
jgi:outer membrane protein assembly factor BamD (BamD/ComL family)